MSALRLLQLTKSFTLVAAIAVAGLAHAAGEYSTMVTGSNNGVTTPYNETCMSVAYQNAYKNEKGQKTTSEDYKNFKCYKDGVEVYCNEITEDGQTEKAKEDIFAEGLDVGNVCVTLPPSGKVYEGTPGDCSGLADQIDKCVEQGKGGSNCEITGLRCYTDRVARECPNCNDPSKSYGCTFGGKLNASTLECVCYDEPKCAGANGKCPFGGNAVGGGTQNCNCNSAPTNCAQQCLNKGKPYGGEPAANGTQDCRCLEEPNCSAKCLAQGKQYGGTAVGNGTQDCSCSAEPNCPEVCMNQGKAWGGEAVGGGTQACSCYSMPNCTYGAASNGTQECLSAPTNCVQACMDEGKAWGGAPAGNGTQDCACNAKPDCAALFENCKLYGGQPKGNGTTECSCNVIPVCSSTEKCPLGYGGVPKKNGTTDCNCNAAPSCPCGAKKNGTQECNDCPTDAQCQQTCKSQGKIYGGKALKNGTTNCDCFTAPNCNQASKCKYGGKPVTY